MGRTGGEKLAGDRSSDERGRLVIGVGVSTGGLGSVSERARDEDRRWLGMALCLASASLTIVALVLLAKLAIPV